MHLNLAAKGAPSCAVFYLFLCAILFLSSLAQHSWTQTQKDPLNEEEIDQVREFGDRPNDRVKLFAKFIEQRITAIKQLSTDKKAQNRSAELRAKIEEFTRLVDELQDNLDTYDEQHADIRKALKELVPASDKWEADDPCSLPPIQTTNSPAKLRSRPRRVSATR